MPGSKESSHPHKIAGKFAHPISAPGNGQRLTPYEVRTMVRDNMQRWNTGQVTLAEVWGVDEIAGACAGSKRYLVGCLGGWGDCPAIGPNGGEFEVGRERARGFTVKWNGFVKS